MVEKEVRLVKLANGEFFFAYIDFFTDRIRCYHPTVFGSMGNNQIVANPWLPFMEEGNEIDIDNSHVICTVEVDPDFESKFRELTSGIVIPEKKLIV